MLLLATLGLLEVSATLGPALDTRLGSAIVTYLLLLLLLLIVVGAYISVARRRLLDHICYIVGTGLYYEHLIRQVRVYSDAYTVGDILGTVMITTAYVLVPLSLAALPLGMVIYAQMREGLPKWLR